MDLLQWVALWSLIATQIGTTFGIYKYFTAKMARIYERFDEQKKENEDKFVTDKVCKIQHTNNASNLSGLESRINDRFDKLEVRVGDAFSIIMDLLKKQ